MESLKKQFRRMGLEIRTMASRNRIVEYDVMMGILSASILCVVEALTYILLPREATSFHEVYLLFSLLMAVQFVGFALIYNHGYVVNNWVLKLVLHIHPFLIVFAGLVVTALKPDITNNTDSFLIALFTVILVQIYPLPKRIALLLFAFLGFNAMMFGIEGASISAYESFRSSLLLCIVGFIYASMHFQAQQNRMEIIGQLETENKTKTATNLLLVKMNEDVESSHRVTDAMLRITTEILSSDRLDDTLQLLLDEAIRLIPAAQAGSILTLSEDRMHYRAARGFDLDKLKTITLGMEDLFQADQKDIFEPIIIRNLESFNSAHLDPATFDKFKSSDALIAKSTLSCSFKSDNRFFGLINLDNFGSEEAFDDDDINLVRHLTKELEITIGIHKLYEKAVRPTKYDELTGACTRKYHRELLEKAIETARKTGTKVAVGTLDINHFKEINDRYGHEVGDDCLAFFAASIRASISADTVFSRIGGDEFALVCPGLGHQEAKAQTEIVRQYFANHPFVFKGGQEHVSFACGIAVYPDDGLEFDVLFKVSDTRMYENKKLMKMESDKK